MALFAFLTVFFMCAVRGRVCAVILPLVSGGEWRAGENKSY